MREGYSYALARTILTYFDTTKNYFNLNYINICLMIKLIPFICDQARFISLFKSKRSKCHIQQNYHNPANKRTDLNKLIPELF